MSAADFPARDGLRYGALGFALAFVALPLYVHLPAHYATQFGVPLAQLGALLLAARGLDALLDPWLGRLCDRTLGRAKPGPGLAALGLLLLGGFVALFFPLPQTPTALLVWAGGALVLTYLAYSALSVLHQAWGARLGGAPARQSRIHGWREGFALVGVVTASVLPAAAGFAATSAALGLTLLLGLALLRQAPRPLQSHGAGMPLGRAWGVGEFRRLLAVFLLNGVAASIPATLLSFFVADRLRLPQHQGLFLGAYFAAAVLSLPLWLRLVSGVGQARCWLAGMGLAVTGFSGASVLGEGALGGFLAVCLVSGIALGADLVVPSAMLTGVVQRAGLAGRAEGAFFGWWSAASKLNLALAAGLALPLLQLLGYAPGARDTGALHALTLAYCVLPCLLKLAAAGLLYRHFIAST